MLQLLDYLKENEIIKFDQDFCNAAGIKKQNLRRIKDGLAHFTPEHIAGACKAFGTDANWILGLTEKFTIKSKVRTF